MTERLVLASLRGFCAGVVRAVDIVERALEAVGAPLYVRHEIVHNRHVVDSLKAKGAVFVEGLAEVPEGAWVVFSAHGVSPKVRAEAAARRLKVLDATCPLVTKVHVEALHFAKRGYTLLYIGHAGHDEAVGTLGEAPDRSLLVQSVADAEAVRPPDPARVAVLTQTTLSVEETKDILAVLKRRFPALVLPAKEDICYATTNRQDAVKSLAPKVDLMLVLGAPNSSNSLRLVEVAAACGTAARLIEGPAQIDPAWLAGARTVGLTSSASAPEVLVQETVAWFRTRFPRLEVSEHATVEEDVRFPLPSELEALLRP